MNRLLIAAFALSLLGAGASVAQSTPSSPGVETMQSGENGQTVDEGTLLERRLAASGRTHGSYRAASSHRSAHHAGRVSHGRHRARAAHGHKAHGRSVHGKTHSRASHHAATVHRRRRR